ncbi:MAG TPA: tyrosine-type recombinase/integrase [Stellaceae bacterium]|jgi:integrase|nr:tyrosine-type recombinase/integrase [Stellaceae bacterium]
MASIYWRGRIAWGRVERQGREYRQSLKTVSEKVAKQRLKIWVEELDRVILGGKPRRTFDELTREFCEKHLPDLRPSSRDRYLSSLEALAESFEGLYLDEINGSSLHDFEAKRRGGGWRSSPKQRGKRRYRNLTPSTIRRDLACLSSMFGYAIEIEWVDVNPISPYLKRGKRRGLREAPPRRRYLTLDEEAKLLAAARGSKEAPDLYDAICVAIDTGLRRSEQLLLRRPQLRYDRNDVHLTEGTKNAKPRDVPLLPRARVILERRPIVLVRRPGAPAQEPAQYASPYLFTNPETGKPYRHMNRALAGAAKRAGIEPLTWHDLRRTCGCRRLQEDRMKMEEVSLWLGHSSITVTEKSYAFLKEEHLQRAIGAATKTGTAAP